MEDACRDLLQSLILIGFMTLIPERNSKISGGRNYAENSTDRKWMGERY